MDKYHLEIDGLHVEILTKAIKNMYLRIYPPHAKVQISVPISFSLHKIRQQIAEKRKWIEKKRMHILSLPVHPQMTMLDGECHYFLGNSYPLEIIENSTLPFVRIEQQNLQLYVDADASTPRRHKQLQSWYRKQMQTLLPNLIQKWEPVVGVQISQWGVKLMKTRWGSCNVRDKRIWLNLELIKMPITCLESVLVHELVHLLERNHNARFYGLMDRFMPDWRIYQKPLTDGIISPSLKNQEVF